VDKDAQLQVLWDTWRNCEKCPDLKASRQTIVFGDGNPSAQIMAIGEAPGETEDQSGVPFVGTAGELLDKYLGTTCPDPNIVSMCEPKSKTFDREILRAYLRQFVFYTNVICCRPPENRDPAKEEVAACRERLISMIYTVDPVVIFTLGGVAASTVIGKHLAITQCHGELMETDFRGRMVPSYKIPVMPLLHPSYLGRTNDFKGRDSLGAKTFYAILKVMHLLDQYNLKHYGAPVPENRPQIPEEHL
jgi:uracil-DNA glycosylase family 4